MAVKTVMISQPMNGLTNEEILEKRKSIIDKLPDDWVVINTFYNDNNFVKNISDNKQNPLISYLGFSLIDMADCDMVIFAEGWEKARGCSIERTVAEKYGIQVIDEVCLNVIKNKTNG